ncbi:hypothetical protein [Neobacillus niacini]|nr:hypothetical protein [Neobacillus niacini]
MLMKETTITVAPSRIAVELVMITIVAATTDEGGPYFFCLG